MTRTAALRFTEIAARPGPVRDRAQALLDELHHHIPFDGAWMALTERGGTGYSAIASTDLDESSVRYLSGPEMARDIERTGADRARPPTSLSDLPYSSADLQTWAECLLPAGFHEALSVALFEDGGRHVGFMTVLFRSAAPPSQTLRRRLARLMPNLASAIDPVRSLAASAAFVSGAGSGVVLLPGYGVARIPGLSDDALLATDSALITAARDAIDEGHSYATFLWPRGSRQSPDGYMRATVLAFERDLIAVACGVVMLSPAGHLRGLTPRELEVLGHVIEGCSNLEIARALAIAPRTVAAHLEHILAKLDATSRTLAAVRAERAGLYLPLSQTRPG
ncbi:LuxR C-terminal-related transcriptional regulator [Curtobacterium flaccumfaciens]|uniref:LuxR C-terminal-related transcriptional regulator n=1 Tax=Curtobacterium poinsettiae TaxID=159612 RepID=A0A9Q9P9Z6_9MICO|nr:helix-turn-helix transcriptional regulator [Curtobacterium flaccumfaciens]UXN24395.1 LuxR C-terminal-related transcriptional regulator [Curtobacterium flaccumfaciens]UYC82513.1 LuxR C-terminal-related transcriptional regulator [Curtobacterium flaccumfaciens pv. poinsettiae]